MQAALVKNALDKEKRKAMTWPKKKKKKLNSGFCAIKSVVPGRYHRGCLTWAAVEKSQIQLCRVKGNQGLHWETGTACGSRECLTHIHAKGSSFCHSLHLPSPMKKTARFSRNLRTLQNTHDCEGNLIVAELL